MAFTAQVTQSIQIGSSLISGSKTYSESARVTPLDEVIPANQTDMLINWTCDVSAVQSIAIMADQDMTFETNAADHAGGNIISLKADVPYIWTTDSYDAFLLTEDVTKLYITNTTAGTLKIEGTYDPTPS